MAALDQLIERVKKTASKYGGLLSLLLAVKAGNTNNISFGSTNFFVGPSQVDALRVQKELERVELKIAAQIFSYNEKLFKKEWTLQQWREAMEALVEDSHYLFGGLALGSVANAVRDPDVKRRVKRDLRAIVRFARALRFKNVSSLPLANNRGRAYLRSFYVTFQLLTHRAHILAGFTEARNILSPAEHCRNKPGVTDGCYDIAFLGWMPIRDMPPIGTRTCGQFCKCYLVYR